MQNYKLFYENQSIIYYSDIEPRMEHKYSYKLAKEKLFIDSLIIGKKEEAIRIYNEIIEEASMCTYDSFKIAIHHIIFSIDVALKEINKTYSLNYQYDLNYLLDEIDKVDSIEKINELINSIINEIGNQISSKKSLKQPFIPVGQITAPC